MQLSKRSIERADTIKGENIVAWYLAVSFLVVLFGGVWVASAVGLIDLSGSGDDASAYKQAVTAAASKAAARDAQKRLAVVQEARDMAEDAKRSSAYHDGRSRAVPKQEGGNQTEEAKAAATDAAAAKTDSASQ